MRDRSATEDATPLTTCKERMWPRRRKSVRPRHFGFQAGFHMRIECRPRWFCRLNRRVIGLKPRCKLRRKLVSTPRLRPTAAIPATFSNTSSLSSNLNNDMMRQVTPDRSRTADRCEWWGRTWNGQNGAGIADDCQGGWNHSPDPNWISPQLSSGSRNEGWSGS